MSAIDHPLQCELRAPPQPTPWQVRRFTMLAIVYLAWLTTLTWLAWTVG